MYGQDTKERSVGAVGGSKFVVGVGAARPFLSVLVHMHTCVDVGFYSGWESRSNPREQGRAHTNPMYPSKRA